MTADLRLQLIPLDLIPYGAPETVADAGGGLGSRLVRRSGTGVAGVPQPESSGLPGDPFATAAEQTYRAELSGLDVRDHTAAGVRFRVLAIDGNPFVSTALLWADTTAGVPGMTDALVCLPRFSTVLVRPLFARSEIGMATTLASVAGILSQDAADPCTDAVFWWHGGRFSRIGFEPGDPQPVLPAELADRIDALPG